MQNINVPLITWCVIAAFAAVLLLARVVSEMRGHRARRRTPLFSIGAEWEEFYVPGDKIYRNDNIYDPED